MVSSKRFSRTLAQQRLRGRQAIPLPAPPPAPPSISSRRISTTRAEMLHRRLRQQYINSDTTLINPMDLNSGLNEVQKRLNNHRLESLISSLVDTPSMRTNHFPCLVPGITNEYHPGRLVYSRPVGLRPERALIVPNADHASNYSYLLADWIPSDKHGSILLGHGNSISILDAGSLDSENIGWNSSELFVDHEGIITCIRTSKNSKESAVGVSNGTCHLIDTHTITHKCEFHLSNMRHESFMQCMDWNPASPFTLAMGTSDGDVILIDCRIKNHSNPFHVPKTHNVNICSVAWHINGHYLAAGRADSLVNVWDVRYMNGHVLDQCARNVISKVQLSGKSVVKSVQWCPWMPNSIAAGGGNDDCTVAVWDVMEPTQLVRIGAQGPVQGLHWSEISRELVACTGNQFLSTVPTAPGFKIWSIEHNYKHVASVEMPAAFKQDDTTLAYMQPIHLAWSPCGEVSLIVDADGQLSFWRLFDKPSVLQKISNNVYHVDQFKGVPLAHYNDSSQISPYPIWPTTVSVPVRKSILPIKTRHRHPAMPYNKLQLSPLYR